MKYRDEYDDSPTEKEAIATGLAIIRYKWLGDDAFSKGMRLLQSKLKTPSPRIQPTASNGVAFPDTSDGGS